MTTRMDFRGTGQVLVLGLAIVVAAILAGPRLAAVRAEDPKPPAAQPDAGEQAKPPAAEAATGKQVKPAKGGPKTGPSIPAIIRSVEPAKSLLTVALFKKGEKGAPPVVEHYELTKDTKVIFLVNKAKGPQPEGKLADLAEGTPVMLQLSADEVTVLSIAVCGRSMNAVVKSVDADKRTITAVGSAKGAAEATFAVAEDAQIVVPDKKEKGKQEQRSLTDLTEDTPVTLQFSAKDPGTVTGITVFGRNLNAVVTSVDAGKRAITVVSKGAKRAAEATFVVAEDAQIVVPDMKDKSKQEQIELAGLTEGTPVALQFSARDPATVTGITVSGRSIYGVVQSVDIAKSTMTIKLADKEQTLPVAGDAKIVIRQDGLESEGRLSDLVGMKVSLSLSAWDQKTVTVVRLDKSTAPAKGGK